MVTSSPKCPPGVHMVTGGGQMLTGGSNEHLPPPMSICPPLRAEHLDPPVGHLGPPVTIPGGHLGGPVTIWTPR